MIWLIIIVVIGCLIEALREFYAYAWGRGYRKGEGDGAARGFRHGRVDERAHWENGE